MLNIKIRVKTLVRIPIWFAALLMGADTSLIRGKKLNQNHTVRFARRHVAFLVEDNLSMITKLVSNIKIVQMNWCIVGKDIALVKRFFIR